MTDETMANQQETELAWLAGLIEGEGWICMVPYHTTAYKGKKYEVVRPTIGVSNTDHVMMEKVISILEFLGIKHYVQWNQNGSTLGDKAMIAVTIHRLESVVRLLERINRYLVGDKAALGKLLRRFCVKRLKKRAPYEIEDKQLVVDFISTQLARKTKKHKPGKATVRILRDYTRDIEEAVKAS